MSALTAQAASLANCHTCGMLSPAETHACPRCEAPLHGRKPGSLQRSWALLIAALVLYIAAFAVGLGPIPWLLMAEILPARARGVASSVATLTNWTCSFVVTECFSTVLAALSPQGTFLLFALVCLAGALYVAAKVPETKGVSLDQIEALFNNAHL